MVYWIIGALLRLLLVLLSDCRVYGRENVPPKAGFVLVSNHRHNLDPVLIGALMGRHVRFMAKTELFTSPIWGQVVRWYGAFPVRRGEADRQALREALAVVNSGGVLGLFPEGHRSRNGQLQRGQAGAALIALKASAPVLPVAVRGTDTALRDVLRRPRIEVHIGPTFRLSATQTGRPSLEQATEELMGHIAALLPEGERGAYGSTDREDQTQAAPAVPGMRGSGT